MCWAVYFVIWSASSNVLKIILDETPLKAIFDEVLVLHYINILKKNKIL